MTCVFPLTQVLPASQPRQPGQRSSSSDAPSPRAQQLLATARLGSAEAPQHPRTNRLTLSSEPALKETNKSRRTPDPTAGVALGTRGKRAAGKGAKHHHPAPACLKGLFFLPRCLISFVFLFPGFILLLQLGQHTLLCKTPNPQQGLLV